MPIESRFSIDAPLCSVPTWIFGSVTDPLPDTKAWIDASHPDTRFLTLSGARLLAKRIAVGLREHGVRPGNRVLLFSENSVYFPALVLGIWMAGCIFTGANPALTARELAYQLGDSEASIMIATEANADVALEAAKACSLDPCHVFLVDDTAVNPEVDARPSSKHVGEGPRSWIHLISSPQRGAAFTWTEPSHPEDTVCTLNYSSGTTGLSKGVEITHYNQVANSLAMEILDKLGPNYKSLKLEGKALCMIPMYHAFCQLFYICNNPRARVPVYVMSKFDFPKLLAHIRDLRITSLLGVPPILNLIAKHPLARNADLSSVMTFGSGAAPLAKETQQAIADMLPRDGATVRQGWGMSELTCAGLGWDTRREMDNTVGELLPGCRARLVDVDTGAEITEANKPGELWMASPTLMRGYWRNPSATAASIVTDKDGTRWFRTGDIATVDNYGPGALFSIVDRAKELIKVKGNQVAPAELDALLLERQDVADAAVVGVTVDGEEMPRAYITRAAGTSTSAHEIQNWVAERVVSYKRLTGGVIFIDSIPKNPSGKILRKHLRELAQKEMCTKSRL